MWVICTVKLMEPNSECNAECCVCEVIDAMTVNFKVV